MTLPLPKLDTLRYDALVAEARDLLPYRAPEWTDHNAHDPGITLLELFAWLTEAGSYRLDRISPASERAFLRLAGYSVRPAQVARAVVAFEAGSAAGAVTLPAGVQLATADGKTRFQTGTPFQVVTARVVALLSETSSGQIPHNAAAASFQPFGPGPAVGDAFYIGFDRALSPTNSRVRLFAVSDELARDEQTWHALHAEHRRMRRDNSAGYRRAQRRHTTLWEHHGVRVAWEYFDGTHWQALRGLCDATRALSLCGPLRFRAPSDMRAGGVTGHDSQWFIRCRLECGEYDCAPRLTAILLNAVVARHAADNAPRAAGVSNGQALQRFEVSEVAIVPGSTQITLTLPDATHSVWSERPEFDRSGPLARHHIIDTARGQVVFGDGRAGRVPEAGASVFVRWQTGGGTRGNLPARSLTLLPATGSVTSLPDWPTVRAALAPVQPFAAWGGAEAETLGAAKARAVRAIAHARCAVTLQDFEQAALQVPGAPVARAHSVAEFHPQLACLPAAGCITVVVLTPCVRSRPDPTPALCRAVRSYLDARRPVATEVRVTGPDWMRVSVRATLRVRGGVSTTLAVASLRAEAQRRIDAFFDPLTGGPEGQGWPFGRPVYRSEVLALLDALPGVSAVERLALIRDGQAEDLCNNLALCPHGLVLSGSHEITVSPGGHKMNEKPLERLNYFNGQRLQAGDFKLEQDYHMRVRRWLNRSLYTQGIAMGLEVYAVPNAAQVRVEPGLAIDHLGREVILLEPRTVDVVHDIGQGQKVTDGPYLVIRYHEEMLAQQDACCAPGEMHGDKAAQGGPSRVLAEPLIECVPDLPHEASGKILLGRIELAIGCGSIDHIDTSVRRYIGESAASKVRQYALEGFRDVDPRNSAKLYFHVRGRQPNSIALYLRAEEFATFHYTEMGHHTHSLSVNLSLPPHTHKLFEDTDPNATGAHTVEVNSITADTDADIWHGVIALNGIGWAAAAPGLTTAAPGAALAATALGVAEVALLGSGVLNPDRQMSLSLSPRPFRKFPGDSLPTRVNMMIDIDANPDGSHGHSHSVPRATKQFPEAGSQSLPGGGSGTSGYSGVSDSSVDYSARTDAPITWIDDLRIKIDGVDCTQAVRRQLQNRRPPAEDWSKLGNGTGSHTLATTGTGELRLDFLPALAFDEGEHVLEISAPSVPGKRNGGRIHYNLYVE